MGAVGYHYNKKHLKSNAKEGKVFFAKYIASKLGSKSLHFCTPKASKKFNIFYMIPRG
jgi:hypothetical protein